MARVWGMFLATLSAGAAVATVAGAQSQPILAPSPSDGHFEVALHARSMRASARAEQAAWLTVTLPLEKLAVPRAAQQTAPSAPPQSPTPPPTATTPTPAETPDPETPSVSFAQLRA